MKKYFQLASAFITSSCILFGMIGCKKDETVEVLTDTPASMEVVPVGHMTQDPSSQSFIFRTNGGGTILIQLNESQLIRVTNDDFEEFRIEFWGSIISDEAIMYGHHENLNGKHIKDRLTNRRTIVFPDGAKMTMISDGVEGPLISVSIYDLNESHRIDVARKRLAHSSEDQDIADNLDSQEADGETGGFEITETGLNFFNSSIEETIGVVEIDYYLLGGLLLGFPNLVNDYFDDPRLGHT